MKLDLFGERWLMQPESISQLFGSVGCLMALRARGSVLTTYTSGLVATCLVVTCSVVTCMLVSVHSLFFFSLYACFSAWEAVHFWCRCPTIPHVQQVCQESQVELFLLPFQVLPCAVRALGLVTLSSLVPSFRPAAHACSSAEVICWWRTWRSQSVLWDGGALSSRMVWRVNRVGRAWIILMAILRFLIWPLTSVISLLNW